MKLMILHELNCEGKYRTGTRYEYPIPNEFLPRPEYPWDGDNVDRFIWDQIVEAYLIDHYGAPHSLHYYSVEFEDISEARARIWSRASGCKRK